MKIKDEHPNFSITRNETRNKWQTLILNGKVTKRHKIWTKRKNLFLKLKTQKLNQNLGVKYHFFFPPLIAIDKSYPLDILRVLNYGNIKNCVAIVSELCVYWKKKLLL
jgi:hypothetical protein